MLHVEKPMWPHAAINGQKEYAFDCLHISFAYQDALVWSLVLQ